MNNVNMANMGPMGGPVGGPPMMNNGAVGGPQQGGAQRQGLQAHQDNRLLLNTYIYEYFLKYGMFDCARALLNSDAQIKVQKDSPGGRRDENGNLLGNGLGDDHMDTDSKEDMDQKRPDDLPAPQIPMPLPESCFLYEWFCLFWDMLNAQKGKGQNGAVSQYVQNAQLQQQVSRNRQQQQQDMLRQMRPDMNQQNFHLIRNMPNGGMNLNMAMKPGQNPLPRTAMANSQNNPQAMHMLQQKGNQMQRDPSDMDGNRARPGSPGSTDNAPSPSKRPRLEGGGPFNNPNQGIMMPNGRPAAQGMPGQQAFTIQNPHVQAKTIATYAANLQQHHGNQMPNKAMPNAPGPQNQGSPMVPQGNDPTQMANFYNAQDMGAPGDMRPGQNGAQAGGGSNHALQDYQMQLMLLEQQNKKRLMMARQEQDLTGGVPRPDGPGGPGGPGGPNAQAFQGTSPQGGRSGASPNPADQMKRGNPQLNNAANMGSPAPDGAHSHNSPNPINFIGGNQMDPMNAPHFYKPMNGMDANMAAAAAAAQMNGNMRPPNSHPGQPFNGQMNPQMMRQQQQAGQGGAPMNWQAGMNGQQMPPQGAQPQGQAGGPQRSMPPPSAPVAAGNAGNSRNATSSPQTSTAAPPTPSQANKAAPKKKDTKNAKSKAAAQKKANANANTAATPAAEPAPEPEAPTPATPITPVAPQPFNNKGQNAAPAQIVPNGQAAPPAPAPAPVAAPLQMPDPSQSFSMDPNAGMDFGDMSFAANPLNTNDVLNDFDFDSFLHDGAGDDGTSFDFNANTYMENDGIGAD
ncbi:Transcriptional regulator of filamentous growth FLO8 [Coniochaeta hoffmannii]|uniref:Transcriptional regulator of filamentous growth FLO8 n=1 Tax=Coniochaeta hoffmannii TaxID=91930 RepID=A0AA38SK36_9PEZI|nr:Transcriptional regulator of filamentous growth FLO8 [Coniochaeta hoffmannii]